MPGTSGIPCAVRLPSVNCVLCGLCAVRCALCEPRCVLAGGTCCLLESKMSLIRLPLCYQHPLQVHDHYVAGMHATLEVK